MSFLRQFRSNLVLSTAPPANERTAVRSGNGPKSTAGTMKTTSSTSGGRKHSDGGGEERPHGGRRSSTATVTGRSGAKHSSSSGSGGSRYGKENPAPIVVYLDKQQHQQQQQQEVKKQPTSILRTNTFTKHDDEHQEQRGRHAISRSDTFTINESGDGETVINSNTFTRHGTPAAAVTTRDVFEPLYAKNIELSSHERLPVVVDSRTYRKKSLKTSKPVQKMESFIKRFERTLFSKAGGAGGDGQGKRRNQEKSSRKSSIASSEVGSAGAGPRFRDVGISCKLDEEEKFRAKLEAMRRSRQDSRDSLVSQREERRRSQSPTKRLFGGSTYDRRSSSSLSNGVVVLPLKEERGSISPSSPSPPPLVGEEGGLLRDSTLFRPTESSFLKSRQKEIEMGYSVVSKRQPPPPLTLAGSPDRDGKRTVNSGTWRISRPAHGYTEEEPQPRERQYNTYRRAGPRDEHADDLAREEHQNALYIRYPFRTDTYRTLREEYDEKHQPQQQRQLGRPSAKPIGIASPRMSGVRAGERSPPAVRKDSLPSDLPKYTFGTEQLQQRRSRFQQFQKSFQKMDDSASEVSIQQSFFVAI